MRFVVGQIACSVLLVVLAMLFARALRYAGAADPGFDPRGVDVATLDSSVNGDAKSAPAAFWRTVLDRVREIPAVESASLARVPPAASKGSALAAWLAGDQPGTTETISPAWNIVDTGYFATLRIPIIEGRDFVLDRHGGSAARGDGQREARATLLAWTAGDRKASEVRGRHRSRTGRRVARRDGRRRRGRHPIEQPDRRPGRTICLFAIGAK